MGRWLGVVAVLFLCFFSGQRHVSLLPDQWIIPLSWMRATRSHVLKATKHSFVTFLDHFLVENQIMVYRMHLTKDVVILHYTLLAFSLYLV